MFTHRRFVVAVALVGSVLGACGGGGGDDTLGASGCKKTDDQTVAKAILACTEKSVVYVSNPFGSGTGVLVAAKGKNYVLTNQHVIDPFASADVRVAGKEFEAVPVAGISAEADIALVGPINGVTAKPLPIADGRDLERGDDVFLLGFPGESRGDAEEDTDAAITKGIVSKVREVKEFAQTYIQTDAKIGEGQSGGPLFDAEGSVVGISGLSYADDAFALALTGADVKAAVDGILGTKKDAYTGLPIAADATTGAKTGTVTLHDAQDTQTLFLPPAKTDRTLNFSVSSRARVLVDMTSIEEEDSLASSADGVAVQRDLLTRIAKAQGGNAGDLPDFGDLGIDAKLRAREPSPNKFVVPIKANYPVEVTIDAPLTDGPATATWTSDLPLVTASTSIQETQLAVGQSHDHIYTTYEAAFDYLVPLTAGQEVQLFARTPQADADITVFEPQVRLTSVNLTLLLAGSTVSGVETYTDTDHGLYGLDAKGRYTATKTGVHRIRIASADASSVLGRFSVSDCAKVSCEGAADPDEPEQE